MSSSGPSIWDFYDPTSAQDNHRPRPTSLYISREEADHLRRSTKPLSEMSNLPMGRPRPQTSRSSNHSHSSDSGDDTSKRSSSNTLTRRYTNAGTASSEERRPDYSKRDRTQEDRERSAWVRRRGSTSSNASSRQGLVPARRRTFERDHSPSVMSFLSSATGSSESSTSTVTQQRYTSAARVEAQPPQELRSRGSLQPHVEDEAEATQPQPQSSPLGASVDQNELSEEDNDSDSSDDDGHSESGSSGTAATSFTKSEHSSPEISKTSLDALDPAGGETPKLNADGEWSSPQGVLVASERIVKPPAPMAPQTWAVPEHQHHYPNRQMSWHASPPMHMRQPQPFAYPNQHAHHLPQHYFQGQPHQQQTQPQQWPHAYDRQSAVPQRDARELSHGRAPELERSKIQRSSASYTALATELAMGAKSLPPLYRRFEVLQHRVMLQLQEELSEMEIQLKCYDELISPESMAGEGRTSHLVAGSPTSTSAATAMGELEHCRDDLLARILVKMGQYEQAVANHRKLGRSNGAVPAADVARYKSWLLEHSDPHGNDDEFLKRAEDLVDLSAATTTTTQAQERESTARSAAVPMARQMVLGPPVALLILLMVLHTVPFAMSRIVLVSLASAACWVALRAPGMRDAISTHDSLVCMALYAGILSVAAFSFTTTA